jgi:hypothetical protein
MWLVLKHCMAADIWVQWCLGLQRAYAGLVCAVRAVVLLEGAHLNFM